MSRDDARPPDARRGGTVASRRLYSGRVLNLDIDTVLFPNGNEGQLEMIRHPGASAVVPLLDDPGVPDPRVILIRQYRHAAGGFLYEIPAGRLDAGEQAIDCARRELREETGYTAGRMEPLAGFYTTPGFIDEYIHAFVASGLSRGESSPEHDELISLEERPLSQAIDMIDSGAIVDGKTIISLLLAQRRRSR